MLDSPAAPPRRILVTGASSGIGRAAVALLAADGHDVTAVARRADRLDTLAADTGCTPLVLDVTDRPAVAGLADQPPFEVVVNNAGLGRAMGHLWEADDSDVDRSLDTNLRALVDVLRATLPAMVAQRSGHVVNIGSVLGLHAGPAALYGATKGAVHLLSQDLRLELQGSGVRVTEICPGRVATEFYDVAIDDPAAAAAAKDSGVDELAPIDVAEAVRWAIAQPRHVNISLLEISPTEQTYGGSRFTPIDEP